MNSLVKNTDEFGPFTRTRSLQKIHFQNPKVEEIKIDDVAYHLARACRFNNMMEEHYSVAEHSVLMAMWFLEHTNDNNLARQALIHDVAEYVFTDLPSPIKKFCPQYKGMIENFESFLSREVFKTDYPYHEDIHALDRAMCSTEQKHFFNLPPETYEDSPPLENIAIQCWDWRYAKGEWLLTFTTLFPEYKGF